MSTRIINLEPITSLQDGDYIVVDNATNGTHKYSASNLGSNVAGNIAAVYSSSARYSIGQYCYIIMHCINVQQQYLPQKRGMRHIGHK